MHVNQPPVLPDLAIDLRLPAVGLNRRAVLMSGGVDKGDLAIRLFGLFTVDVPGDAKLIDDAAKAVGPEGFLQGHTDGSIFS